MRLPNYLNVILIENAARAKDRISPVMVKVKLHGDSRAD
jgi:hypothetical protein